MKFTSRYIGSLLLVALMLTTTIGISIYKHTCLVTGHKGVSLFTASVASINDTHACCAANAAPNAAQATQKGCCEESASFYQLDIPQRTEEHFAYQQPLLPVVGVVSLYNIDLAFAELTVILPQYNNLPPPDTQSRLALLQVYTI